MPPRRLGEPERLLINTGFLLVFAAFVCNPWVLGSLTYSGAIKGTAARTVIFTGELLLLGLGVAILAKSNSPALVGRISRLSPGRRALLRLALAAVFAVLTIEALSWVFFFHLMPAEVRWRALYTVGVRIQGDAPVTPRVLPYLWSNYAPNPRSEHANAHGWRYGGGPKNSAIRILCLGGSTTWSDRVSAPDKSYPARLEAWLRERGRDVDVVNAGAPYYSSAELVGALAFRGLAADPDIVIIHTGGNDVEPLLSSAPYAADYSHWRRPREAGSYAESRDDLFAMVWRIPSWAARFAGAMVLKPDARSRLQLGRQKTTYRDAMLGDNDVSGREPVGLERNLRNLVAMTRADGALPVTLTFNMRMERLERRFPQVMEDAALRRRLAERSAFAYGASNRTIRAVSEEMSVPVIPFHAFEPSDPASWVDHAHLDDRGTEEKAEFIGRRLLDLGVLDSEEASAAP